MKIRCDSINYRKGFLEVCEVHKGRINLEVWGVHPDVSVSSFDELSDEDIIGNVELELSVDNAQELVKRLKGLLSDLEAKAES